jgi:hypothetical protein
MGNFLVIAPSTPGDPVAATLFDQGLAVARSLKGQTRSTVARTDWVLVGALARRNGTGAHMVSDPASATWILTTGVWFHSLGYGEGSEERLLSRYLKVGAYQLARELEGFYCIVIGDATQRELIVITDIVGSCHCFLRRFNNGIALSTSSLLLAGLGPTQLDPVGCQEFLATGVVYEERSCYRDVRKIGPARVLRITRGSAVAEQRYWSVADLEDVSLDGAQAVTALWDRLAAAAESVSRAFPRPVCDLTGGYDSRAMVAAFLGAGARFSSTVSGPEGSPDVSVSKGLAQHLGIPHWHLSPIPDFSLDHIWDAAALTDGEYDAIEYAQIQQIHETLLKRFDISINGSFGEIARGYWWELLFPRIGARHPLDSHKLARTRFVTGRYDPSLFPAAQRLNLVDHFATVIERTNHGLSGASNTLQMDNTYLMMRMQRWQGRIASSTNQLWPCLSPFMFRSVLETMLKVRPRQRLRSLLIRQLLAQFQPKLAAYPLEHGYPAMPATWRTLPRFFPLVSYYSGRAARKLAQLAGRTTVGNASGAPVTVRRLHLWQDQEVCALLDPARMRAAAFLDPSGIAGFLGKSRSEAFSFDGQWSRLLSLECALRAIELATRNAARAAR